MIIIKLLMLVMGNAALAALLYLLDKKTSFGKIGYKTKQLIIGVLFGALACYSSGNGIPVGDTVAHVRDAGPLCAGLIFGAPSGIIAGFIGGIYRWFSVYWGAGEYTRFACMIATILVGFVAAAFRKYMFDDKKPTVAYGFGIAAVCEVIHMLIIFLTHMEDIMTAFIFVRGATIPVVVSTGMAVGLAVWIVNLLGREKKKGKKQKQISQTFQTSLLICILVGFALTSIFTLALQTNVSRTQTLSVVQTNVTDVRDDIRDASDRHMLETVYQIRDEYLASDEKDRLYLGHLASKYDVHEINIISDDFLITSSNVADYIGYDMGSGEQSEEFRVMLGGETEEFIQEYRATAYEDGTNRKYGAVTLPDGGFIQAGYNGEQFQRAIDSQINKITQNRHIGRNGFIVICDEEGTIVTTDSKNYGKRLKSLGVDPSQALSQPGKLHKFELEGVEHFCSYASVEGYYIIGLISVEEANFIKNVTIYVSIFTEIIIFAAMFILIYVLIKKVIIDNIRKINKSLAQITSGNLNVKVDVRDNEEFASLSDDINSTVTTLKKYIAEASARIDKELEFAKQIQYSALPSVFPPFPTRRDIDIYASMDAAKEVGGDFYDFYLLNDNTLAFLVADVSGKGIGAAMFMMRAKTIIKDLAESGMEISEIFTRANDKLCENNDARMFVTAWMGIVDLSTGKLSFVNAGHNPPLIKRAGGKFEYIKDRSGFVLAGRKNMKYRTGEIKLCPGDAICLYTDGITEATDSSTNLYGEDRLIGFVNSNSFADAEAFCKGIKSDVDKFVGNAPQFDDMTLLAVKINCIKSDEKIELIPNEASRQVVNDFAYALAKKLETVPKVASKVNIAIDEIYSNIVNYSAATYASIASSIESGMLTLVFEDNGQKYNPLEAENPDVTLSASERKIGGLGIFMVKKMTESMEYKYEDNKNILTLTIKLV